MVTMAVTAVAAPMIGGIVGHFAGASDRKKAAGAMRAALSEINAVGAPPDESSEIIREKLKQVGLLTPEVEKKIDVGISKVAQITEDESLRKAQTSALEGIQKQSQAGLTASDRAALDEIRSQTDQQVQGQRQQLIQSYMQRGLGGAGAELAAQLQAGQGGANLASKAGLNIAGQAQERALAALTQSGRLGGEIRAQDFNVNQVRGSAADELSRFDIGNQINQQSRNVTRQQDVQNRNLREQQRIQDQNAQDAYNEKLRQSEARRNYFTDKLSLAKAKSSVLTGQANQYNKQAAASGAMWGGVGAGIGQAAGALGAASITAGAKKAGGAATGNEVYGSGTGRIYGSKLGGVGGP